ncbi:MAG: RecX family transcriptional regulator [Spirochaetes bacterium]|nr:RecX family transcriptional regulator [Spirochaetota bacterium]
MPQVINIKYADSFIKVDLDTGESLKLAPEIFSMYSLSVEKILDGPLYQQLKEESVRFLCKEKALNYLATRSRSYLEMQTYLRKKDFPKNIIQEILNGLRDRDYINDYEYALRFINYKKKSKVIGTNSLKRDLFRKGISRDLIKKAIKETGADSVDPDEIFELALKKYKKLEGKKNRTAKLVYFLRQRGFEESAIRPVLDRLKIEEE